MPDGDNQMCMDTEKFVQFLELPEDKRLEQLFNIKLTWYQRLVLRYVNRWWSEMKHDNQHLKAARLFESVRKGRF